MSRIQKIALLNSWNVKIPTNATNIQLDDLISRNRRECRVVNFKGGKINVAFDKADATPVEVMIYEDIGDDPWMGSGFTAKDFMDAVKDIDTSRALDVRINSAGGSVWEGLAIKTRMDEWKGKKTASIDGMAASVASWLPMSFDEIRAPRHAQMFIHDAWGMCIGNEADMDRSSKELGKTSDQISEMYARRTGMTKDECRDLMKANTLMTGEEAYEMGFIDRLTDDEPVSNFTESQLNSMKEKLVMLNKITTQQGGQQNNKKMRKQLEALLNKLGVKFNAADTDEQLLTLVENHKATPKAKAKNKDKEVDDEECDDDMQNAPEPSEEKPDADADDGAPGDEGKLFKEATENSKRVTKRMENFLAIQRKESINKKIENLISEGRITATTAKDWAKMAVSATDSETGENPILNQLATLPQQLPGTTPLNIELGEPESLVDVSRAVDHLLKPSNYYGSHGKTPENHQARLTIGANSKQVSRLVNSLKKYDKKMPRGMISPLDEASGGPALIGPLRNAIESFMSGRGPQNANTMSSQLLRQVILSEVMRAFRRQFASLEIFAHNFNSVPLEGTDYVEVPYYPLDTVASSEFTYAQGYQIAANAQTLYKQVYVGGVGNGVATPGSGRKYKPLQFTAYEIRRQPWLDIQKLSVMAGEQLAIDVRGDIMGTQINAANFGNAIWTGAANGFDHTVVGNTLLQAAILANWPLRGRNVVLAPGYYTNLAIDPAITPLLAIGTTDILREGIVGGLYGFENIIHDPRIPIPNYIRGGDGTVVAGTDPQEAGFMAYPSAVLIATAPIMPPPGVLKKLVAYEQITDDQTGLAFTYQFFGNETANADSEIIECTYGSGLGELAALFRLTSAGN